MANDDTAKKSGKSTVAKQTSWEVATELVERLDPVPSVIKEVVRVVYSKPGVEATIADPSFSIFSSLLSRAMYDETLSEGRSSFIGQEIPSTSASIKLLGADVAAALCFVHAICRRVLPLLVDRVSRPIYEDALMRGVIGFHVGVNAPHVGSGQGLLVGFASRAGLLLLLVSSGKTAAEQVLKAAAGGSDIGAACQTVYGCHPLEVSTLTLIGSGCHRDIALGLVADEELSPTSATEGQQETWKALLDVVCALREGSSNEIPKKDWDALGFSDSAAELLTKQVAKVQRRGHQWSWLAQSITELREDVEQRQKPK